MKQAIASDVKAVVARYMICGPHVVTCLEGASPCVPNVEVVNEGV